MIVLVNPTSDELGYQYGGLSYTVPSKKEGKSGTRKVQDSEGHHALNSLGARGLTKVEYDDEGQICNGEKNEADAIERNRRFKISQIERYNYRNQQRKANGQSYDTPTPEVSQYAVELGIDLLQPYTMATGERSQIAKLTEENETKDKLLKEQGESIAKLTEMVQGLSDQVGKGFIKPKDDKDPMVKCPFCNESVLSSKLKSHMTFHHPDKG
jgi:hypothetical protein